MHLAQRHANGPWRAFDIGQGDLILRAPGRASYEVRWKSHSSTPAQTLHLHLSHQLVARAAEQLAGHDPTRVALLARVGFRDPVLAQIGLALWRELEQPDPAGKLYAQTAAQMLAVHLLRHYPAGQVVIKEPAQALTQQQIRRVSDYVQAHLGQDISLEALAQQAGFSPYYFARLFRRTTGESPHQYVLRQRIECAQRLLGQRDVPLAQIALASGFANQSHFTRAFKRHLGLTPRAYRQDRSICADF